MEPETQRATTAAIVGTSSLEAFGLTPPDRLRHQLSRAGISEAPAEGAEVLFSGGHVFGNSVIAALAGAAPGTILRDQEGQIAGLRTAPGQGSDLIGQQAGA
ncbi:MAG: hypothetical protein AAGI70_13505, partial [Pseudomonadota bacterium]